MKMLILLKKIVDSVEYLIRTKWFNTAGTVRYPCLKILDSTATNAKKIRENFDILKQNCFKRD
jgi:hypothetical protein